MPTHIFKKKLRFNPVFNNNTINAFPNKYEMLIENIKVRDLNPALHL